MTPEEQRFHAAQARRLVRACGTLEEAAAALRGRLKKSRLQEFTSPTSGALMDVDVMMALQEHCGHPLYSEAISARLPAAATCAGAGEEACAFTESAARLQHEVRRALADGRLTPREKGLLTLLLTAAELHLRNLRLAAERGQP